MFPFEVVFEFDYNIHQDLYFMLDEPKNNIHHITCLILYHVINFEHHSAYVLL